jgi:AcrR family transcriptional regulator
VLQKPLPQPPDKPAESADAVGATPPEVESGRERVMRAAYELFSRYGTRTVGVDAVISEAGVAKMTLYRNFASKDELILAFLERREALWTHGWVRAETQRRAQSPAQRLLAIFEIFGEWFARPDFEGCSFVTTLLEVCDRESPVRQACVQHLANIRSYLCELASQAGVADPDSFARQWHILMKGSIIAAAEGDIHAAARARELGILLLKAHGIAPE